MTQYRPPVFVTCASLLFVPFFLILLLLMQTRSVKEQGVKNHDTLPEGEYKFAPSLSVSFFTGDDAQSRTAILHAVLTAAAAATRFTWKECKRRICHLLIGERGLFLIFLFLSVALARPDTRL